MGLTDYTQKEYENLIEQQKENPYVSNRFKIWIVGIIFALTFLHLYSITAYPNIVIIPKEVLLSVVLAMVGYIWIQEIRDRHRLIDLNHALIKAHIQLEQAEIDAIKALIQTEEAKDPYVRGHSKQVAKLSLAIAEEMGFSKDKQKLIERSAILHDIGKLGISDKILNKPAKLDEDEWEIMKSHPMKGVNILEPLRFLDKEKDIMVHHHERCDGNGYPDGLKGEDIPLESRILAVADTFDAMNSKRAYRGPLNEEVIIGELKKSAGTQLDSSIVDVFLKLIEKKPQLWERD